MRDGARGGTWTHDFQIISLGPYQLGHPYMRVQSAEHPIDSLSSCGASITERLPAEFEPLTVARQFLLTTTNKKL